MRLKGNMEKGNAPPPERLSEKRIVAEMAKIFSLFFGTV
jgi:hypothetical protein